MKKSSKFATSPNILVAKGKNSVANATVLVAISSPVMITRDCLLFHFLVGLVHFHFMFAPESVFEIKVNLKRELNKITDV